MPTSLPRDSPLAPVPTVRHCIALVPQQRELPLGATGSGPVLPPLQFVTRLSCCIIPQKTPIWKNLVNRFLFTKSNKATGVHTHVLLDLYVR